MGKLIKLVGFTVYFAAIPAVFSSLAGGSSQEGIGAVGLSVIPHGKLYQDQGLSRRQFECRGIGLSLEHNLSSLIFRANGLLRRDRKSVV